MKRRAACAGATACGRRSFPWSPTAPSSRTATPEMSFESLRESGAALHAVTIGRFPYSDEHAIRERSFLLDDGPKATGGQRIQLLVANPLATYHGAAGARVVVAIQGGLRARGLPLQHREGRDHVGTAGHHDARELPRASRRNEVIARLLVDRRRAGGARRRDRRAAGQEPSRRVPPSARESTSSRST